MPRIPEIRPGDTQFVAEDLNYAFQELERIRQFFTASGNYQQWAGGTTMAVRRRKALASAAPAVPKVALARLEAYRLDQPPPWPKPIPVAWTAHTVDRIGGTELGEVELTVHALRWPFVDVTGAELPLTRYLPAIPLNDPNGLSDVPIISLPFNPASPFARSWEDETTTRRWYVRGLFVGYCV